jgi:hypothetical protein
MFGVGNQMPRCPDDRLQLYYSDPTRTEEPENREPAVFACPCRFTNDLGLL